MINQKSVDSYHKLLEEGVLSKRQAEVYHAIMTLGQCTNRMIAKSLNWDINRVTGRVTELREKNLITYAGDYKDKETNRTVNLWKVGGQPTEEENRQKQKTIMTDVFESFANIFGNPFNK